MFLSYKKYHHNFPASDEVLKWRGRVIEDLVGWTPKWWSSTKVVMLGMLIHSAEPLVIELLKYTAILPLE